MYALLNCKITLISVNTPLNGGGRNIATVNKNWSKPEIIEAAVDRLENESTCSWKSIDHFYESLVRNKNTCCTCVSVRYSSMLFND